MSERCQEVQGFLPLRKSLSVTPLNPPLYPFSHYGYVGAIALAYLGVAVMLFFVLFQAGVWPGALCVCASVRLSRAERAY